MAFCVYHGAQWRRGSVSSPRQFLYTALFVFLLKNYVLEQGLNMESCVAGKGCRSVHSLKSKDEDENLFMWPFVFTTVPNGEGEA